MLGFAGSTRSGASGRTRAVTVSDTRLSESSSELNIRVTVDNSGGTGAAAARKVKMALSPLLRRSKMSPPPLPPSAPTEPTKRAPSPPPSVRVSSAVAALA